MFKWRSLPYVDKPLIDLTEVHLGWSNALCSQYPPQPSLLAAYISLKDAVLSSTNKVAVTTARPDGRAYGARECRLGDAITHAIEAVHGFLFVDSKESQTASFTNHVSMPTPSPTITSSHALSSGPSTVVAPPLSPLNSSQFTFFQRRYDKLTSTGIALSLPLLMYALNTATLALYNVCAEVQSSHRTRQCCGALSSSSSPGPSVSCEPSCEHGYAWFRDQTSKDGDLDTQVDKVIDALLELILLPLIRAFYPLCLARLRPFLEPRNTSDVNKGHKDNAKASKEGKKGTGKPKGRSKGKQQARGGADELTYDTAFGPDPKSNSHVSSSTSNSPPARTDIGAKVLALVNMSIHALDGLLLSLSSPPLSLENMVSSVKERVALETIRELEALYSGVGIATEGSSFLDPSRGDTLRLDNVSSTVDMRTSSTEMIRPQTRKCMEARERRTETLQRLAIKDTAWYLCSVLKYCLPAPSRPSNVHSSNDASSSSQRPKRDAHRSLASRMLTEAIMAGIGRLLRLFAPDVEVFADHGHGVREGDGVHADGHTGDGKLRNREEHGNIECWSEGSTLTVDPVTQSVFLAICEEALSAYGEVDLEDAGSTRS